MTSASRRRAAQLCAALALIVAGCRPEPASQELHCTLIGGVPVLRVVIAAPQPGDSVRVAAVAMGTAPRAEEATLDGAAGACASAECAAGVPLYRFAPETAVVTLTGRERRARHVVVPRYALDYPNGPRCPGAVRVGRVTLPTP